MTNIGELTERLVRARAGLLAVAEAIPPELWQKRPGPDRWSAAEVIAHLTMVETAVLKGARKLFQSEPQPVAFWRRLHISPKVSEYRFLRARTPIPLDPSLVADKDSMLEQFRALRAETLAFLETQRGRDLRRWRWPHPFFGSLNGESWFRMIAHHEIRHTKQLREIVQGLK